MKKVWFKAKRYGWGWYPCTWQGWLILFIALGAIVINFLRVDALSHSGSDTLIGSICFSVYVILLLIVVCYLKGEQLRWRWGGK